MLLGVAGFVKGDWLNVKPEDVKKVADHGFVSALLSIPDPSAGSDKDIANIKSLYASNGLIMPMTRGGYGGGLCSDDEDQRAWTVNFLEDTIRLSAKMGCPTTYFRTRQPQPRWRMVTASREPVRRNFRPPR